MAKNFHFFPGFVTWILFLGTTGLWNAAQGYTYGDENVCMIDVTRTNQTEAPCKDYLDLVLTDNPFTLMMKESFPTKEEYDDRVNILMDKDPKYTNKMCIFSRSYSTKAPGCCAGWTGPDCLTAICEPPCSNNGQCTAPHVCTCDSGYAGTFCDEIELDVDAVKQYCYASPYCHGEKADGFENKLSYEDDCCKGGGAGWGATGGKCEDCAVVYGGEGVVDQVKDVGFRTCLNCGSSYFRTFDGREYQFQGRCKYTLAADSQGKWQVDIEPVDCDIFETCRKEVTIFVASGEKLSVKNGEVYVDGQLVTVSTDAKSTAGNTYTILKKGDWIMITTSNDNLRLKVDYFSTCYLTLDDSIHGTTSGLCGNFNEDFKDDLRTKSGELTTNPSNFGNSWRTDSSCSPTGPIVDYCHDLSMKSEAMEACGILRTGLFRDCRAKISYLSWYQMCVNEYCKADTDQKEHVRCYHVGAFAHECAQVDIIVSWRSRDVCAPSCPNGLVYNECSSPCPRSCSNVFADLSESCSTKGPCLSGCECPGGTILQDGKCVTPDQCKCHYNKEYYAPGDVIKRDCNECECDKGVWICTEERCSSTARIIGLSHVKTFDGQEYDLDPNVAKYTFVERTDDAEVDTRSDLVVDMSFDNCPVIDSSYDRNCLIAVHIKYKSTHITLRGSEVLIDGETIHGNSFYYFHSQDVYIKQATNLYIMVKGFGFQLLYDRSRAVYLTLDRFYMHKVRGLFGTYNDNRKDDYMARNDYPSTEPHLFAHGYSDSVDSPKRYSRSYQTAAVAEEATKLCELLSSHQVFAVCLGRIEVKFYISKCYDDYISSTIEGRDKVFCDITAAMAMECANIGTNYISDWTEAAEWKTRCMAYSQCNNGGSYTECASVCNGRCRDTQMSDLTCQEKCVPGCQCPSGQLYNGDGQGPCVTLDQCSCFNRYDGSYVEANTVTRQGCTNCTCANATWSCDNEHCDEDIICPKTQIYRLSITGCEPTCDTIDRSVACSSAITYDGCGCPENTYKTHNGRCVKKDLCPCTRGGEYFEPNSLFEDSCKTYRCVNRHWLKISETDCPGVCWASGDPHYQTFDEVHYSFQGKCEYTLVRESSANHEFEISTTNVECGTTGISCTKSVTIRKGQTSIQLVRGHPLTINGVANTDTLIKLTGVNITVEFPWTSVFLDEFSVLWDNGTRVFIFLDSKWKGRVEGLCGNFDGIDNNDFQSQSGITDPTDINTFANSWRKATNCPEVESDRNELIACSGGQSIRKAWAEESCRIIKEGDLFHSCRDKVSNFEDYYDDCLFDACSCDKGGDCECLCTAIANFAEECNRIGVFVKWRTPRFCPIMCENGLRYTPCMSPCRQTCRNIGNEPEPYCNSTQCVEGCFCPEGYIQHDDGCIPADECPCYENGIEHPSKSVITHECMKCTCVRGKFECEGYNCITPCKEEQFTCDDGQCIGEVYTCDGHMDCRDGSDEAKCNCSAAQFTCQNGACIDMKDRCDGFKDCADSSDEWYCKHECESTSYEIFQCDNGDCLPASFRCDGHYDCRTDISDEANCTTPGKCDLLHHFRCIETGKCIPKTMECDGHDDCGDGNDEDDCTTVAPTTTTTTIMTTTTATTTTTLPTTTPECEYVNGFEGGFVKQDDVRVLSDGETFGVARDIFPDKGLIIPWTDIMIIITLKPSVTLGYLEFKNPEGSNIDQVQVNVDGEQVATASVNKPIPLHGVLSDNVVILIKSRRDISIGVTISIELRGCFYVASTTTEPTTTSATSISTSTASTSTPSTTMTTEFKPCDISEGLGSRMKIRDSDIEITNGYGNEDVADLRPDGAGLLFQKNSYLKINFDATPVRLALMNVTTVSQVRIKVTIITASGDLEEMESRTPSIVRFNGQTFVKQLQVFFLDEGTIKMELFGCFHYESTTASTSTTLSTSTTTEGTTERTSSTSTESTTSSISTTQTTTKITSPTEGTTERTTSTERTTASTTPSTTTLTTMATTSPICEMIEIDGDDTEMYTLTPRLYGKNMQDAMRKDSGAQTTLDFPTGNTPFLIDFKSTITVLKLTLTVEKEANDLVVVADFDDSTEKANEVSDTGKVIVTFNLQGGLPVTRIGIKFIGVGSVQLSDIFLEVCKGVVSSTVSTTTALVTSQTTPELTSPPCLFFCDSNHKCLKEDNICDGTLDCYDGSDETNCSPGETTTTTWKPTSPTLASTTTVKTTLATTTTEITTTVGQQYCDMNSLSLQGEINYSAFEPSASTPLGYYIQDGERVLVEIGDQIEIGEIIHFYCYNCTCASSGQFECSEKSNPCSCKYFPWSDWTQCSKTCGTGIRRRTRQLIPGYYDEQCEDEEPKTEECTIKNCEYTTTPPPWTPWTPCNAADCKIGTQTRTRCESNGIDCKQERQCSQNNTECSCPDGKVYTEMCDYACNSTCKAYRSTQCDESENCENMTCICKEGTTEYNGECIKFSKCPCFDDDGIPMPQNTTKKYKETCQECTCTENGMDCRTMEDCCEHDTWSEWTECYNNKMCGSGLRTRYSEVIYGDCEKNTEREECILPNPCGQCVYNGVTYNDTDVVEEDEQSCIKKICINSSVEDVPLDGIDGAFGSWLTWGPCSATMMNCNGTRARRRSCNTPSPSLCGKPCEGDYEDIESCSANICCEVTPWSTWENCSKPCGTGTQTRTRDLVSPSDASYCNLALTESDLCNIQSCETNCTVSNWSDWTPCSVTCGLGTKSRYRNVTSETSDDCPHLTDKDECYPEDCECDTNEAWTNTSGCEKTCQNRYEDNTCDLGPPKCECKPNFVRNDDGHCVEVHECNNCKYGNETNITEGEVFEDPLDKCYTCICEAGEIKCNKKCNEPSECLEGEIRVMDANGCCHVCKKDTCSLHTKTETLVDITYGGFSNCSTEQPITYAYCSGGCGDSTHFPKGLGLPSECKCCTSVETKKRDIELACIRPDYTNGISLQTVTIEEPTMCQCDVTPCQPGT